MGSIGSVPGEGEVLPVPLRDLQVVFEFLLLILIPNRVDFQSPDELPGGEAIDAQPGMVILLDGHVIGARNDIAVQKCAVPAGDVGTKVCQVRLLCRLLTVRKTSNEHALDHCPTVPFPEQARVRIVKVVPVAEEFQHPCVSIPADVEGFERVLPIDRDQLT